MSSPLPKKRRKATSSSDNFSFWHRRIEIGMAVLMGLTVVLAITNSRFCFVPLPLLCILVVIKSAISLREDYLIYRRNKAVSMQWILSLAFHSTFTLGSCFWLWVTTKLAIAAALAL